MTIPPNGMSLPLSTVEKPYEGNVDTKRRSVRVDTFRPNNAKTTDTYQLVGESSFQILSAKPKRKAIKKAKKDIKKALQHFRKGTKFLNYQATIVNELKQIFAELKDLDAQRNHATDRKCRIPIHKEAHKMRKRLDSVVPEYTNQKKSLPGIKEGILKGRALLEKIVENEDLPASMKYDALQAKGGFTKLIKSLEALSASIWDMIKVVSALIDIAEDPMNPYLSPCQE